MTRPLRSAMPPTNPCKTPLSPKSVFASPSTVRSKAPVNALNMPCAARVAVPRASRPASLPNGESALALTAIWPLKTVPSIWPAKAADQSRARSVKSAISMMPSGRRLPRIVKSSAPPIAAVSAASSKAMPATRPRPSKARLRALVPPVNCPFIAKPTASMLTGVER